MVYLGSDLTKLLSSCTLEWARDSSDDHTERLKATFSTKKAVSHCPDLLSLPNAARRGRLTYRVQQHTNRHPLVSATTERERERTTKPSPAHSPHQ